MSNPEILQLEIDESCGDSISRLQSLMCKAYSKEDWALCVQLVSLYENQLQIKQQLRKHLSQD